MVVDLGAVPWRWRMAEFRRVLEIPGVSVWLAYRWGDGIGASTRDWE